MVLRKQQPPGIQVPPRGTNATDHRSPVSRSPASPRSAGQRSKDSWELDTESVYSPDLRTSPAFDLMPLEEAQKSPMSAHNPWEDELVDRPEGASSRGGNLQQELVGRRHVAQSGEANGAAPDFPSTSMDTARLQTSDELQPQPTGSSTQWGTTSPQRFRANNPFARPRTSSPNPWEDGKTPSQPHEYTNQAPAVPGLLQESPERSSQTSGIIPMTARLSIFDQTDDPWSERQSQASSHEQSALKSTQPVVQHDYSNTSENIWQLPPGDQKSSASTGWMADSGPDIDSRTEWQTMGASLQPQRTTTATDQGVSDSTGPRSSSPHLIDLDDTPTKPEFNAASGEPQTPAAPASDEQKPPATIQIPPTAVPPLSEAEIQRFQEKQAETYAIRHINWTDATGKLRESPVLVQNKNGPCPLLALVNALILRSTDSDPQQPIVRALQTRENISLGLLIQALFDELTYANEELPDIEALSRFLTMLHTGMNVNPRLTLETPTSVGAFHETSDLRFYDAFRVPLLHGWIAEPTSKSHASMVQVAQYFEDIQLLPFRKEELEDRVIRNGSTLTADEERLIANIDAIQYFVEVENPTQLSSFGLSHLSKTLAPGSVSILFRNDHFSTLYKHPQSGQLFTLITDAGYADHPEIVWESLVDVTGANAEFFSGDFRPVGHGPSGSGAVGGHSHTPGNRSAGHNYRVPNSGTSNAAAAGVSSSQTSTEQEDADYAYALSLQFQEEARQQEQQQQRSQTRVGPGPPSHRSLSTVNTSNSSARGSTSGHRYSQSSSAANRLRSQSSASVPSSHSNIPMDAPSDHDHDENAPPPSYDQVTRNKAAAGRASWATSQRRPQRQSAGNSSLDADYARRGQYPGTAAAMGRRQQQQQGHWPPVSPAALERGTRGSRDGKDCIVM